MALRASKKLEGLTDVVASMIETLTKAFELARYQNVSQPRETEQNQHHHQNRRGQ